MNETAKAFDIADVEDLVEVEYEVKDPLTSSPTGIVFKLGGPEYGPRKRIVSDRTRRMAITASKTGKVPIPGPEEAEELETDLLVAATIGWSGLVSGGQPVPFSKEAAAKLYTDPRRRWLRQQIKDALDDRELFTRRSAAA